MSKHNKSAGKTTGRGFSARIKGTVTERINSSITSSQKSSDRIMVQDDLEDLDRASELYYANVLAQQKLHTIEQKMRDAFEAQQEEE
jgi:ribosomal protein RSM22 (predicted rRNA methylase)